MGEAVSYRRIDWFVLACVAVLVTYGVLFVGSAQGTESARLMKQLVWIGLGVVAFVQDTSTEEVLQAARLDLWPTGHR